MNENLNIQNEMENAYKEGWEDLYDSLSINSFTYSPFPTKTQQHNSWLSSNAYRKSEVIYLLLEKIQKKINKLLSKEDKT